MLGGMRRRRSAADTGLWAAGLLAALAAAPPAAAQGAADKAAAEALFDEGKKLFIEKKYAEACPRFEASERLDPGIGTLLFLADCYEQMGRAASAWATFREAASVARAAAQSERERVADERARILEPRLYRLTVKVEPAPGLRVTRNQAELKPDAWNVALPVDAGAYTLEATAPGRKPWSQRLSIPEGPGAQQVTVPALDEDPTARRAPEPARIEDRPLLPPPPAPAAEAPGHAQRIAGIVVGSVGLTGLALGGALGGAAAVTYASARSVCPGSACSAKNGVDQSQQAGVLADAATAALVVGGAALGAGVLTFLLAPSAKAPTGPRAAWLGPAIGPGVAGLAGGMVFR
jgi:hypothetical protein